MLCRVRRVLGSPATLVLHCQGKSRSVMIRFGGSEETCEGDANHECFAEFNTLCVIDLGTIKPHLMEANMSKRMCVSGGDRVNTLNCIQKKLDEATPAERESAEK
ncbi:hypothetical protein E2C01_050472 [Portunus trituberculatus]|uniref:Uncharacterized protein n=1 Tax=Portunus trituberculatus TaxID=210409 RepID=A0A5B7G931_PORTR|nr:hypothetical protein [Portunus trituberculatus]